MQHLIDFLTFDLFISPYIIIISYYIGALVIPFASWFFVLWARKKYGLVANVYSASKETFKQFVKIKHRILLYLFFLLLFVCMEIMWRVMFEFIIAYLQMRDALLILSVP